MTCAWPSSGASTTSRSSEPLWAVSSKHVDFGGTRGFTDGPDAFGYEAFAVGTEFEDITETGKATLQLFGDTGFAVQAGGTGTDESNSIARDAAGNLYITGLFSGQAQFGEGATAKTLTAAATVTSFWPSTHRTENCCGLSA